ncbi:MAG: hypothetical protein QG604_15 [Candidatus Dependentiae bacterium]|nr:hypothetical protein [Candidatus Dependentiae bacterium]
MVGLGSRSRASYANDGRVMFMKKWLVPCLVAVGLATAPVSAWSSRHVVGASGVGVTTLAGMVVWLTQKKINRLETRLARLQPTKAPVTPLAAMCMKQITTEIERLTLMRNVALPFLPIGVGLMGGAGLSWWRNRGKEIEESPDYQPIHPKPDASGKRLGSRLATWTVPHDLLAEVSADVNRSAAYKEAGLTEHCYSQEGRSGTGFIAKNDDEAAFVLADMIVHHTEKGLVVPESYFNNIDMDGSTLDCGFNAISFYRGLRKNKKYGLARYRGSDIAEVRQALAAKMKERVEAELAQLEKRGIGYVGLFEQINEPCWVDGKVMAGRVGPTILGLIDRFSDAAGGDVLSRSVVGLELFKEHAAAAHEVVARLDLARRYGKTEDELVEIIQKYGFSRMVEAGETNHGKAVVAGINEYLVAACKDVPSEKEMSAEERFMYVKSHPELAVAMVKRFALPFYTGAQKPSKRGEAITEEDDVKELLDRLHEDRNKSAEAWIKNLAFRETSAIDEAAYKNCVKLRPLVEKMLHYYEENVGKGKTSFEGHRRSRFLERTELDNEAEIVGRPIVQWTHVDGHYVVASVSGGRYFEAVGKKMSECMHMLNEGNGHWRALVPAKNDDLTVERVVPAAFADLADGWEDWMGYDSFDDFSVDSEDLDEEESERSDTEAKGAAA